ncbi:hypothetical protein K502DRAFT_47374 [Neoconidiobolus thromboides FSU 785]|nr:hypothetical protein K502DRAFT_47374 [Neoconidiobolus thromboides FSU 785]
MKKEEEMKEIKKETNLYLSENKQEIQSKIHNIKKAHEEFDLKLKQFNQLINSNFDEMLELKIESKIQECFNALYPFKNKDNLLLTLLNKKEEIDANTLKQDKITQFETEFYKQIQSYLNKWKETSEEEDINSFKKFIHFVIENDNKRGEKAREEEKEIVSKIKNHLLPIAQEASVNLEVVFDEKKELEEFSG